MPHLTRVRLEAACLPSKKKEDLEEFLIAEAAKIRDEQGGSWTEEEAPQVQSSKNGWWGRYTIRRDANG